MYLWEMPTFDEPPRALALRELFFAFAQISLSGFGGVLPWARRTVVEDRRWTTADEFNEALALCQLLPGPNIVNFSVIFGSRSRGIRGAAVAVAGLLGPPMAIVLGIAVLYDMVAELAVVRRLLAGIAAAAAGLVISTAVKMVKPLLASRAWASCLIGLVAFASVGVAGVSLPLVVVLLAPVSVALAWGLGR